MQENWKIHERESWKIQKFGESESFWKDRCARCVCESLSFWHWGLSIGGPNIIEVTGTTTSMNKRHPWFVVTVSTIRPSPKSLGTSSRSHRYFHSSPRRVLPFHLDFLFRSAFTVIKLVYKSIPPQKYTHTHFLHFSQQKKLNKNTFQTAKIIKKKSEKVKNKKVTKKGDEEWKIKKER